MPDTVTSTDLRNLQTDLVKRLEDITKDMQRGFDGVYERQDKTNGRLLRAEDLLSHHTSKHAANDVKVQSLTRELFGRRSGKERREASGPMIQHVTQRDVLVFIGGASMIWTVLKAIRELAPFLGIGK